MSRCFYLKLQRCHIVSDFLAPRSSRSKPSPVHPPAGQSRSSSRPDRIVELSDARDEKQLSRTSTRRSRHVERVSYIIPVVWCGFEFSVSIMSVCLFSRFFLLAMFVYLYTCMFALQLDMQAHKHRLHTDRQKANRTYMLCA